MKYEMFDGADMAIQMRAAPPAKQPLPERSTEATMTRAEAAKKFPGVALPDPPKAKEPQFSEVYREKRGRPASGKVVVSLRLEPDVVEKFRATGPGWQARMNDALKAAKP